MSKKKLSDALKKAENHVFVVDKDNYVEEEYEDIAAAISNWGDGFEKRHPIEFRFNNFMERCGINSFFGYSPSSLFTNPLDIVKSMTQEIKFAYQRVYRGFDDRATWGLSDWMVEILPRIIESSEVLPLYPDGAVFGNITDEEEKKCQKDSEKFKLEILRTFLELEELNKTISVKNYPLFKKNHKKIMKKLQLLFDEKYFYIIGS